MGAVARFGRAGRRAAVAVALVTGVGVLAPAAPAGAEARTAVEPAAVAGELLVRFDPTLPAQARAALRAHHGLGADEALPVPGLEVVRVAGDPAAAAARLNGRLGVDYAEPNYLLQTTATVPSDPYFGDLWGLHNTGQSGGTADADIDAPEAFDVVADTSGITIAVIDTGIDVSHPDLAANIWKNPGETAGNGIDDDGNGYVDDVNGWDFLNGDRTVYDATDGDQHGTHVAGTLSAVADNGRGVAGVTKAKVMPLKFLGPDGGSTSDAVKAIDYAIAEGAEVANLSWAGSHASSALSDAIDRARTAGMMVVAAAGNGGEDGVGDNIDVSPLYPAAYTHSNIVSVAATTRTDGLARFSNYGSTSVDLGAPGASILSTVPGGYGWASGTSMATPHVAGAVAHVMAKYPSLSLGDVRSAILTTGDAELALSATTATGRRLNLASALAASSGGTTDGGTSGGGGGGGSSDGGDGSGDGGSEVPAGGTASTDPEGSTTSSTNPVILDLTTPVAGTVELTEVQVTTDLADHLMMPTAVDITAPQATAADPLVLDVELAAVALPEHGSMSSVTVFRNGVAVPACTGAGASPDPCVSKRTGAGGGVSLKVLTSAGSRWRFGVPVVNRIAGADRVATSVATSRAGFVARGAGAAVLSRADAFPDALAGAGLAAAKDGPLLLTTSKGLHADVAAELRRILPAGSTVHLLGGTSALAPAVADEVKALGFQVRRHAGADRYATAVAIAQATDPSPDAVLVTTGDRFPDALTASAAASAVGGVVVLSSGSALPRVTADYLAVHTDATQYAVGGPAAAAVPDAVAVVGADRYETAALVADRFLPHATVAGVATGLSFPDALSAGARLARMGAPLLLADGDLTAAARDRLGAARRVELYGGESAVSDSIEGVLRTLLR